MKEYRINALSGDNSAAVAAAVERCRRENIKRLVLEKGEYHFYPELAAEARSCCVSNHGHNGFRRTAFLLEDMTDFELDASGSLLVFHGAMNAVIARGCSGLTVKNADVLFERTNHAAYLVTESTDAYTELEPCGIRQFVYENGLLYHENEQGMRDLVYSCLELDPETHRFAFGEQCFGNDFLYHRNGEAENGRIRVYAPERRPKTGNAVVLIAADRYANAFLAIDSRNVTFSGCCVYSCYGIAYMAQKCENVTLERCRTDVYEGRHFSANADASHFVCCRGSLRISDCDFKYQLDDGINIHGVFTRIIKKTERSVIVRYSHYQCRGIGAFEDGCRIAVLREGSLIPYAEKTVSEVRELNTECTELVLEGGTGGIRENDIADSLDFYPEVLIENNRFIENRGRGILMGSGKRSVVRNNYFRLNGTPVLLESDCAYWYESGAVRDLLIEGNVFEGCIYTEKPWGSELIKTSPRASIEKDRYYHGRIEIKGNDFSGSYARAVDIDNTRNVIIEDNRMNGYPGTVVLHHCGSTGTGGKE